MTSFLHHHPLRCAAMAIALFTVSLAAQATLIMDISGGTFARDGRDFTLGWSFRVDNAITVNGLGLWDEGGDGFAQQAPYEAALWTAGGALLATALIDNASAPVASSNAAGRWMFEDIAATVLGPGDYVVAYLRPGNSDDWRFAATPTTVAGVTFLDRLEQFGSSLVLPTNVTGNSDGHFGPNLRIADVPEPATLALAGLALAAGARRRRS